MAVPKPVFLRTLYPPSSPNKSEGDVDVIAVKRAISRVGEWPWQAFDDEFNEAFAAAVGAFRKRVGLSPSHIFNEDTFKKLAAAKAVAPHAGEPAFDAVACELLQQAYQRRVKSKEQVNAEKLYDFCGLFDGSYQYGGEHDRTVADDNVHNKFDCSSSTSFALWDVGLLGSNQAQVSGWFKYWGQYGRGRFFTVWAANDHVWIEFTIPGRKWARFDTSPKDDGPNGPRMRHKMRDTERFVPRHALGY